MNVLLEYIYNKHDILSVEEFTIKYTVLNCRINREDHGFPKTIDR